MKILIPSARTAERGSSKFVAYTLHIIDGTTCVKVERRYSDFHALQKNLRRLFPSLELTADFPPKKIRHLNEKVTQERRVGLQVWLQSAVDVLGADLPACLQEFLDLDKNISGLLNEDDYGLPGGGGGGGGGGYGPGGLGGYGAGRGVGGGGVGEHQPILSFVDEPFKDQDSPTLPNIVVDATLDAIY